MATDIDLKTTIGWRFSGHARRRAAARGGNARAILETIADPEVKYPSGDHTVMVRGDLAIVVDEPTATVITVLLHSDQGWSDADARKVLSAA